MTPFAVLCGLAGLSHREAGDFLGVRLDTVKSWSAGRNRTAPGAIDDLRALIARQAKAADEAVAQISHLAKSHGAPDEIEIGYPADDHEAQSLGWPCVGAWAAMAARACWRRRTPRSNWFREARRREPPLPRTHTGCNFKLRHYPSGGLNCFGPLPSVITGA